MVPFFHKKEEMARCSRCGKEVDKSEINTCVVCGVQGCTCCKSWNYFHVMKKEKVKIIEAKAFCSADCEKKWIKPHIDKFMKENEENAETLLKDNMSEVKDWFCRELGYPGYDIYFPYLNEFSKQFRFAKEIEQILAKGEQIVGFESFDEITEFMQALRWRCKTPLNLQVLQKNGSFYMVKRE